MADMKTKVPLNGLHEYRAFAASLVVIVSKANSFY